MEPIGRLLRLMNEVENNLVDACVARRPSLLGGDGLRAVYDAGQHVGGAVDEVLYTHEEWAKRAKVASECVSELQGLARRLDHVVRRNYFGVGCVEGGQVYAELRSRFRDEEAVLAQYGNAAQDLARAIEGVIEGLTTTDREAATRLGGGG